MISVITPEKIIPTGMQLKRNILCGSKKIESFVRKDGMYFA